MLGESNPKFSKTLMENGDNNCPGISKDVVPSVKNADYAMKNSVIHSPTPESSQVDANNINCLSLNINIRHVLLLVSFQQR